MTQNLLQNYNNALQFKTIMRLICTFFWNYWYKISLLSKIITDLMIVSIVSKRANSSLNCDNWCGVLSFVLVHCVLFDIVSQYCNSAVVLKVCFEMQTVTMCSGRIFAVQPLKQTHGAFLKPLWKIRELHRQRQTRPASGPWLGTSGLVPHDIWNPDPVDK